MLLAKVSHMAKRDVSSVGKYKPPADSEVWPSRRGSTEGNKAGEVAQRQMIKGYIMCQGLRLSCGQGAATEGF